jgi:hypothetical protein
MKKAQGISINVIIVAAIALIVLVVLVAIFTGRLGIFTREVSEVGTECSEFTETVQGTVYNADWQSEECGAKKEIFTAVDADDHPGEHCCVLTE